MALGGGRKPVRVRGTACRGEPGLWRARRRLRRAAGTAVFTLVSLVGLFAFIRGAFTLRAAADGKPGASGPKAFAHMAGGIAAWHIVAVIEAVQTSLGIAVLNIR